MEFISCSRGGLKLCFGCFMYTKKADACEAMAYSVDPKTVICDFEQAVINAVIAVLGSSVDVHGCFYHLS